MLDQANFLSNSSFMFDHVLSSKIINSSSLSFRSSISSFGTSHTSISGVLSSPSFLNTQIFELEFGRIWVLRARTWQVSSGNIKWNFFRTILRDVGKWLREMDFWRNFLLKVSLSRYCVFIPTQHHVLARYCLDGKRICANNSDFCSKIKSVGYKRVMCTNKNLLHCSLFILPSWIFEQKRKLAGESKVSQCTCTLFNKIVIDHCNSSWGTWT